MVAGRSDLVEVDCEKLHETEKGILVYDGDKGVWLPKSAIEFDAERGVAVMPERLAFERGLI